MSIDASTQSISKSDFRQLVSELREQNLDSIRFATYRAAAKLRFIQKKVNMHLVDIWNVIEAFRENGLNAVEFSAEVKTSRMELLLSTLYHNLNKRLPSAQHIDTDTSIRLLLAFLLGAYDREELGRLRVFSIKVALATLCAGKLIDKLRYMFSQISDCSGVMDMMKFNEYLREVLALPTAVFEGPTFGYTQTSGKAAFDPKSKVTVNVFLDTLMADPCPANLMWLPLLHRMANVEHVFHPVVCDGCGRDAFTGFRYKCQRCHNYQLCQECFWRGRVSASHTNQHEMKEYSSYKSPSKQLEHSVGKSLRCGPSQPQPLIPVFPDQPDRPLNLTNLVPGTPSLIHPLATGTDYQDMEASYLAPNMANLVYGSGRENVGGGVEEEHKLIARYSAKLAGRTSYPPPNPMDLTGYPEENFAQRCAIARLEQRNKEIMREIEELRGCGIQGSSLMSDGSGITGELDTLRNRKAELEDRMSGLQDTRRDLMGQLEGLMGLIRKEGGGALLRETSPPGSLTALPPDLPNAFHRDSDWSVYGGGGGPGNGAGGTLPRGGGLLPPHASMEPPNPTASLPPLESGKSLQGDLLSAADSITNTMSSLVNQLHVMETNGR